MTDRDIALQNYLNNPCHTTRNALIAHHHGLINLVIRRYMRIPDALHDDAFQEGVLGLCKGIERFDPIKGEFAQYAMAWIRASIKKWMESNIRHSRCSPMRRVGRYNDIPSFAVNASTFQRAVLTNPKANVFVDDDQGSVSDAIPDDAPGPYESAATISTRRRVREILSRLSVDEREAAIIKENVCEDVPLNILAARFGVSKQRMCQIKQSLMHRMESSFEPE